jgi:cholesterol oxidase
MPKMDYDLVVIGSGFGGAVCAMRAAEAGMRVCVLERGARLTTEMREAMAEGRRPILHERGGVGFVEMARVRGLMAVTGSAVGGGSQVYTAATIPAADEVFAEGWPGEITSASMKPYYERVQKIIAPTTIPTTLARTAALESTGRSMGASVTRLPLAMEWPEDAAALSATPEPLPVREEAMAWLAGGAATKKRTLDKTYLARAEAAGAEIRELHEVTGIAPRGDGYAVRFQRFVDGCIDKGTLSTQRVVLAAGAIGTVRMLFECRDVLGTLPHVSGALGERFFTNGDFGAAIVGLREEIARDSGPPTTAWIDCWKEDRLYLMELGLLPPMPRFVAGALGMWAGAATKSIWAFGVMGFDERPGRLVMDRRCDLELESAPRDGERFHARTIARLRELAEAVGGKLMAIPDAVASPGQVTVHPLGGAAMADDPQRGVVDANGEVFGHPGLFVADGSLLPTPIGRAPSMTIAALAEKISDRWRVVRG